MGEETGGGVMGARLHMDKVKVLHAVSSNSFPFGLGSSLVFAVLLALGAPVTKSVLNCFRDGGTGGGGGGGRGANLELAYSTKLSTKRQRATYVRPTCE